MAHVSPTTASSLQACGHLCAARFARAKQAIQVGALLAGLAVFLGANPSPAITFLFAEDFEGVPLTQPPSGGPPNVWSDVPPFGWDSVSQTPPTVGSPDWERWVFVQDQYWKSFGGERVLFDRGLGTIAVADGDLWNDPPGGAPDSWGRFGNRLISPTIDLSPRGDTESELTLAFDVSWKPVERTAVPNTPEAYEGNQTAIVLARFGDGQAYELERWESAPFLDGQGVPTFAALDPAGTAHTPNPNYQPPLLNERWATDVQEAIDELFGGPTGPTIALASSGPVLAASSTGVGSVGIEFLIEDGGDDGWLGLDNVELASYDEPEPGDMYIDGILDALDVDEFAKALLDTEEYSDDWLGEAPAERGNLNGDGVFDFDDIDAFLSLMETEGALPMPALALAIALGIVPEPSAAVLLLCGGTTLLVARRRRRGQPC